MVDYKLLAKTDINVLYSNNVLQVFLKQDSR